MIHNEKSANIALIVTALVWGTGFIGTEQAIQLGAKTSLIITLRFFVSALSLGIIYQKSLLHIKKNTLITGFISGILLFLGFYIQTFGQALTTVSNSAFLTTTNVIMIPFIVWCVTKKIPQLKYFILATTCMFGVGILTLDFSDMIRFQVGDIFIIVAAFAFACQISYLGIAGKGQNVNHLTFIQMSTVSLLAFCYMILFDREAMNAETAIQILPATVYLGLSCGSLGYYLQTAAQQYASPSKTGIILCMEGLSGCVFSVMLGIDPLTTRLVIGGFIIITSVILAELDWTVWKKKFQNIH